MTNEINQQSRQLLPPNHINGGDVEEVEENSKLAGWVLRQDDALVGENDVADRM